MNRRKRMFFVIGPLAIVGIALFLFLGGEVVKLLWNWVLPPLFGWKMITFWQAFALLALCRILFGHHGWGHRGHSRGRDLMRERMSERWQNMTPEQRERMRKRWSAVCGFEPPDENPTAPSAS